jgi:hypothetical protein
VERCCQHVVDWPDTFGLDNSVNVVEVREKVFAVSELFLHAQ